MQPDNIELGHTNKKMVGEEETEDGVKVHDIVLQEDEVLQRLEKLNNKVSGDLNSSGSFADMEID